MAIYLDLETIAIPDATDYVETVSAPANYKDPAKIAAYITEAQQAQTEKAALYPWTAKIVALGVDWDNGPIVALCPDERTEAEALRGFWSRAASMRRGHDVHPLTTFNGLAFDLPVLAARSRLLGVPHPTLNLDKYRSPHRDLLQELTWRGAVPARSLKWYARRFGLLDNRVEHDLERFGEQVRALGLPMDPDPYTGRDIAQLVREENWDAIAKHCASDLRMTRALAEKLS